MKLSPALIAFTLVATALNADVLVKRDGTVMEGSWGGGTEDMARLIVDGTMQLVPTRDIASITFSMNPSQPPDALTAGVPDRRLTADSLNAAVPAPATSTPANETTIIVPIGTPMLVALGQTLSSDGSKPGDKFTGSLVADVRVNGVTVIPAGNRVTGNVVNAEDAGRGLRKREAVLAFDLTSVNVNGKEVPISTSLQRGVADTEKGTIAKGALRGAALGAIIGSIDGNLGKGAAAGAAAGGASSTLEKGENIEYATGTVIAFDTRTQVVL